MIERSRTYSIAPSYLGPVLTLHSQWTFDIKQVMRANHVTGLELNYAKGWVDDHVNFLHELEGLRFLKICDWKINDIKEVNDLHELRHLEVSTYCKTAFDFHRLPHLESLGLEWRSGCDSLFDSSSLKELKVNHFSKKNMEMIGNLANLKVLCILSCRAVSADAIAPLKELRRLRLALMPSLHDCSFLTSLVNLEDLWIQSCRGFTSLEPLRDLKTLRSIVLEDVGNIESLEPIRGLPCVERFDLSGRSSVVDGKVSVLHSLPNLRSCSFVNRKHYEDKWQAFPQLEARVWGETPYYEMTT